MQNAGLDDSQAGIKIAGRNINSSGYADDTTAIAESKRGTKEPLVSFSHLVMFDSLGPHGM